MGAMFWFGLMLAVVALPLLLVKSRRHGSVRGDAGSAGETSDGGSLCDTDAGGCDGGNGGGGGD